MSADFTAQGMAGDAINKNKTQQTQIDSLTTTSTTKQKIVRTSSAVVVNAASFTIPTATIDANEALDIDNSIGADAVVTLAAPTGNSKKDILLSVDNGSFDFSIGSNYTAKAGMVILARFNGTDWIFFASENAKQDKVRATLNIANKTTNYTIPTVDIDNFQAFEIAQTTANIVFSLGSPTGGFKKDIQIKATSTADLYINSTNYTLKAGQLAQASFNGTNWNILVGGGVTYSTTEKDTGNLWIDNKKIYRKTYTGTTPNNNNDNILFTVTECTGEIINYFGIITQPGPNRRTKIESLYSGVSSHGPMFQFYLQGGIIREAHYVNSTGDIRFQNTPYTVTVEYTK